MRRVVFALLLVACGGNEGGSAAPIVIPDAPRVTPTTHWWQAISIDRIDVLQGSTITILADGKPLDGPVIAARPGLVRFHARLSASTDGDTVVIPTKLTVSIPGEADQTFVDEPKRVVEYVAADLGTTFDFTLPASAFDPRAHYRLSLLGTTKTKSLYDFPKGGDGGSFGAKPAPTLRVRYLPVRLQAEGHVPLLDGDLLEAYRKRLYRLYPVSKVEQSVEEKPLEWPLTLSADAHDWDQLLLAVMQARRDAKVADDVYQIAIIEPGTDLATWCAAGCATGLAPFSVDSDLGTRSALVLGYGDDEWGALPQELGHAMGRQHAPCGDAPRIDIAFPYVDGGIGVPGFDVLDLKLVGASAKDFMGYCQPNWVSDYTFRALAERMAKVEAALPQ